LFSGERAKDLVDLKIDEISKIVEIPHPYDWPRLREALERGDK
tara:strand:+ start:97 stop:225 length:129 start_codon:yes stop_codon:yes gene_type:complete